MLCKRNLFILAVVLTLLIVGCAGPAAAPTQPPSAPTQPPAAPTQPPNAPTQPPAAPTQPGAPVVLTYARYADTGSIDLDFMKACETQLNIQVNSFDVPGEQSYQKLLLMHQAGNPPDVFWTHWPLAGATSGMSENLDPYIAQEGGKTFSDRFMPGNWDWVSWQGSIYAIPWRGGASVVYFNQDLLNKAGLATPKVGWTWDDFTKYAVALTKADGSQYGLGLIGSATDSGTEWDYWPFLLENGGQILKNNRAAFNSPEGVAALQYLVDLIQKEKAAPPGTASNDVNNVIDLFVSGKAAMWLNGPWYISTMKSTYPNVKFSVAQMPTKVNAASIMGGTGMAIEKLSKHKQEAWNFIKCMTSDDNLTKWAINLQHIPPNKSAANDPYFKNDPNMAAAMAQALSPDTVAANHFPDTDELNQIMATYLQAAYTGKMTPQQALDQAAKEWNNILPKYDQP